MIKAKVAVLKSWLFPSQSGLYENFSNCSDWLVKSQPSIKPLLFCSCKQAKYELCRCKRWPPKQKVCIRGLGRGSHSKNKQQSPPASPCGSSTNVLATRLERRMEAAQSNRTRDKVAHSWVNHYQQVLFGYWNILILTWKG